MNPKTKILTDAFISSPSSTVILEGSPHSGATSHAEQILHSLLGQANKSRIITVKPDEKNTISIDQIRELKSKLVTIAGKSNTISRGALIYSAEELTPQAQNALLKIIEEPVANSLVILATSNKDKLLDTILSRCQVIPVLPLTKVQARDLATHKNIDELDFQKFFIMSQGQSVLFNELIDGKQGLMVDKLTAAKKFIGSSKFERLARQKEFDIKEKLIELIFSLQVLAEAGLHGAKGPSIKRWESIAHVIKQSSNLLENNVSTKLVFLRLSIMV